MTSSPTPASARRERNRLEMREAILGAARNILVSKGVSALSMRAVARDIGYSVAALYEYFPSKAALCRTLFFEGATGLSGRISAAMKTRPLGAPARQSASIVAHAYRDYALENPELYLLVFSQPVPEFVPNAADLLEARGAFTIFFDTFRNGIDCGELRAGDPIVAALTAWSFVHGFVMLEIAGFVGDGSGQRQDALFNTLLENFTAVLHTLDDDTKIP